MNAGRASAERCAGQFDVESTDTLHDAYLDVHVNETCTHTPDERVEILALTQHGHCSRNIRRLRRHSLVTRLVCCAGDDDGAYSGSKREQAAILPGILRIELWWRRCFL